jgi:hypothetical protein
VLPLLLVIRTAPSVPIRVTVTLARLTFAARLTVEVPAWPSGVTRRKVLAVGSTPVTFSRAAVASSGTPAAPRTARVRVAPGPSTVVARVSRIRVAVAAVNPAPSWAKYPTRSTTTSIVPLRLRTRIRRSAPSATNAPAAEV